MDLKTEQRRLRKLLNGRTVKKVWRRREDELVVVFEDGWNLYVDWQKDGSLDLSVTGGTED